METENNKLRKKEHLNFSRLRIIKNLTVISSSFVLLFTAYDGLSMLQSTMNKRQGVGTVSQAVVYTSFGLSSLLLPNFVIKKLGTKNTLFIAILLYIPYIAANFHPLWSTMIPSAVLIGIGAAILWGSQCTYFNESSVIYCTLDEDGIGEILNQVTGSTSSRTSLEKLSESSSAHQSTEELQPSKNSKCGIVNSQLSIRHINRKSVEELNVRNLTSANVERHQEIPSKYRNSQKLQKENDQTQTWEDTSKQVKRHLDNIKEEDANSEIVPKYSTDKNTSTGKRSSSLSDQISRRDTGDSEIFETYSAIDSANAFFFGCHGLAYYSAQIWGNLMSFFVLHTHSSHNFTRPYECACGADFCDPEPECLNDDTDDITTDMRNMLTSICVGLGMTAALLIFFFLDPLNKSKEPVTFSWEHVMATFHHSKKKEQMFLVPLSLYVGMAQGFYTADVTKSYVACAWGTSHVGLVTIFYGLACALSSTVSGCLVHLLGRIPIFLLGQIGNLINYAFLLMWSPEFHHPYMFYLAAALWGIITGLFWSQLQALYGVLFQGDEEAAFGSYYLYSSLGWTISFLYSNYICTSIKIYILCAISCVGIIGYLITERQHYLRKKQMIDPS
ncbi:protein unc-93 homolog A [Nephila pilipes]|uniref:Protein unc-93 homolog A n=1 Tax=Nephila pilipes TaxID=299642 RepID=A0A8X6M830_NEPPI|nr:protein unc-93 homolog A [Nephila pilipes]